MHQDQRRISFINNSNNSKLLRLTVISTTGGVYRLSVSPLESIAGIKCTIARKLRLHAHRMSLLHRDRVLLGGNLLDNQVVDGSQLTLVPNMETGTVNKGNHCRVMQALENLSETQVNDFLTGRAPLLLAMKLGEHMMFVQLQLSTSSCASRRRSFAGGNSTHCSHTNNSVPCEKPKSPCSCAPSSVPGSTSGAVIDSVNHLGQGVYSGTFSGTLDPSLQDATGRPKRDINTILQILNDLLVASPQLRQSTGQGHSNIAAPHNRLVHEESQKARLGQQYLLGQNRNISAVDERLRGKVQALQQMMHERKLRRQEKRGMRAPYQWPNRDLAVRRRRSPVQFESSVAVDREVTSTSDSHANADASFAATASSAAMEHESVLV